MVAQMPVCQQIRRPIIFLPSVNARNVMEDHWAVKGPLVKTTKSTPLALLVVAVVVET
jgi:hypothetical protein